MNSLAGDLIGNSSEYLLLLTSIGTPFSSAGTVATSLFNAVNALGGNGYLLYRLTTESAKQQYTLISSTDSDYVRNDRQFETSTVYERGVPGGGGTAYALLSRDRNHRWVLQRVVPESDNVEHAFDWETVSNQQPTGWPAWTPNEELAYEDLTASTNRYPEVTKALGCAKDDGTADCQPVRSYYDDGIGSLGSEPAVINVDWADLQYVPNSQYTSDDFETVRSEIESEAGWLHNIYLLYNQFQDMNITANSGSNSLPAQLKQVAKNIQNSMQTSANAGVLTADLVSMQALFKVGSFIPGAGVVTGPLATLTKQFSALIPKDDGTPNSQYTLTLNSLSAGAGDFSADMSKVTDTLFAHIANDYGKMKIMGEGWGSRQAPWYTCESCDVLPPVQGIPMIALESKQRFYKQLLPTVYSFDTFFNRADNVPQTIASQYYPAGSKDAVCYAAYDQAPSAAWADYNHPGNYLFHDFFIMSQTKRELVSPIGSPVYKIYFPSEDLLDDLFKPPSVDNANNLTGGAGLTIDGDFLPENRVLKSQPGYLVIADWPCTGS
jgi:hypothetical protein